MNNHGGFRPNSGRKKSDVEREVVKAYPLPDEKKLLEQYAKEMKMSLSAYLLHMGLKK